MTNICFFCLFGFFLATRHVEVPRPRIKPAPKQQHELLWWQCQILNPMHHKRTPHLLFIGEITYFPLTNMFFAAQYLYILIIIYLKYPDSPLHPHALEGTESKSGSESKQSSDLAKVLMNGSGVGMWPIRGPKIRRQLRLLRDRHMLFSIGYQPARI